MSFKRYLFLAACIVLYVFGFIAYFTYARAAMEGHFREERQKYHVDGLVLTSTNTPSAQPPHAPAQPPVASAPVAPTPDSTSTSASSAPASTDTTASSSGTTSSLDSTTSSPTDSAAPTLNPTDTNLIIGPMPPPASAPSSPDTNASPASPSSTMNQIDRKMASYLVRAAYQPSTVGAVHHPGAMLAQTNTTATNAAIAASEPAPSTNAASSATNAAPSTASGPIHTVAVEPSVIVLLYHQFVPAGVHLSPKLQWTLNVDVFEAEMKYLHDNGYHVIPMSDLHKFLRHEIGLPPNSVVITIDDGYKSAIVHAAPILKKYGYPWTYFVYPDFITVNEGAGAASWNDLLALQADGVDIESHSMSHPTLTKHTQKWKGSVHLLSPEEYDEWLTNETLGSKKLLEQKLGKTITALAYPYGAYNKEVEAKAIAAGYEYIYTVADNPVRNTTDPHSIGRYTITQSEVKNFASDLRQGALGLADVEPAPGSTVTNPRPVISAVLGYEGALDPKSIETSVRDFGDVHHDFDPKTSTLRLYLPRDLVQSANLVTVRVKDAQSGKTVVANWRFNYQAPGAAAPAHAPISSATNAASAVTNAAASATNAPAVVPAVVPAASMQVPATSSVTNSAPEPATNIPTAEKAEPAVKSAAASSPAGSKLH